ncbi:MAG: hypothetical protein O2992_14025, partial [Gemmatimonadetes bacterium]|nr:hypothetical protein [Gemmatimonadota bacterium]
LDAARRAVISECEISELAQVVRTPAPKSVLGVYSAGVSPPRINTGKAQVRVYPRWYSEPVTPRYS